MIPNEYKLGKYKFSFVAPKKTNDATGYYSLQYTSGIPKDYIRMYFTLKPASEEKEAGKLSVSIPTWEAIKGKYVTILCNKVKENSTGTQSEVMEDIQKLLQRNYRNLIPTIIYPNEEESEPSEEQV